MDRNFYFTIFIDKIVQGLRKTDENALEQVQIVFKRFRTVFETKNTEFLIPLLFQLTFVIKNNLIKKPQICNFLDRVKFFLLSTRVYFHFKDFHASTFEEKSLG